MTKLSDLDAVFLSQWTKKTLHEQEGIDGAQGVMFLCPLCQHHQVLCWFKNPVNAVKVPDDAEPWPGRWTQSGTSIDDLTLEPSVNLDVHPVEYYKEHPLSCRWHGWVEQGDAA